MRASDALRITDVRYTVRLASPDDAAAWDAFADAHAPVPALVSSGWCDVLAAVYGVPVLRFLAVDHAGAIVGCCPAYVAGDGVLYSFRYGLVAADDAVATALLAAVRLEVDARRASAALVTSGPVRFAVAGATREKETVVMPVASSEGEMWSALRNKTRNMIRRAERSGCTVRTGHRGDLDAFYRCYARRMLAKGVPIHSREFFAAVLTARPHDVELLVAERDGAIIAGMLFCVGLRRAVYPFAAVLPGSGMYAPMQLLIWEALRRCVVRRIPLLDMGESSVGGSVHASKMHFGGVTEPITYYAITCLVDSPRSVARRVRVAVLGAARIGMRVLPFPLGARLGVAVKRGARIV